MNVIHTANPVEHANNAMMQPNFINPVHHASVDLSGHNLVNAHQASGVLNRRHKQHLTLGTPDYQYPVQLTTEHLTTYHKLSTIKEGLQAFHLQLGHV